MGLHIFLIDSLLWLVLSDGHIPASEARAGRVGVDHCHAHAQLAVSGGWWVVGSGLWRRLEDVGQ